MTEADVHSSERGLFQNVEFSLTSEMDVRCASFHPIDPVLACGLGKGNLVFLRGSHHSTPFENWEIEPKHYRYGRIILSVQWNADGTKVAAGSDDGTVSVWSYPGDGKQEFRRNGRSNFPLIVWNPFNPDVFASYNNALDTKQVMIANFANEKPLTHTIESYLNCLTVAWISYKQLACGYDDGTFEVHELGLSQIGLLNSEMVQKIGHDFGDDEHDRATSSHPEFQSELRCSVSSIAMNMELGLLASVGTDRRVKLWFWGTNDPTRIVKFPLELNDLDSNCKSLVWCSDIKKRKKAFLACGLENGTIVIWYLGSNETLKLSGHDQIHQLLLSPDKRYLASIDYFKKLIIWCTESWEAIYILPSSGFKYPYMMTWDAASSKLGISGRRGQGQFNVIEYGVAEKCCAVCKNNSENLKRCSRCRSIYYCGRECQRSHWPQHKLVCNRHE